MLRCCWAQHGKLTKQINRLFSSAKGPSLVVIKEDQWQPVSWPWIHWFWWNIFVNGQPSLHLFCFTIAIVHDSLSICTQLQEILSLVHPGWSCINLLCFQEECTEIASIYWMYGCTFPINGNCGKEISLVTGQVAFEPSGISLWPMSIERLNFIGSPGHSTKTQRCQNISLYNSQQ